MTDSLNLGTVYLTGGTGHAYTTGDGRKYRVAGPWHGIVRDMLEKDEHRRAWLESSPHGHLVTMYVTAIVPDDKFGNVVNGQPESVTVNEAGYVFNGSDLAGLRHVVNSRAKRGTKEILHY